MALVGVVALIAAACGGTHAMSAHTTAPSTAPAAVTTHAAASHTATAVARPHRNPAPVVLETVHTALGTVLADHRGRTVYVLTADQPARLACNAGCVRLWPIVAATTAIPAAMASVHARLGALDRGAGVRQLTVNGRPVYTFTGDTGPAMTTGQGEHLAGGVWRALTPAGAEITTGAPINFQPPAPPTMPTTPPMQAPAPTPPPMGIAQHNGGDHDADNNGGPIDGDGSV